MTDISTDLLKQLLREIDNPLEFMKTQKLLHITQSDNPGKSVGIHPQSDIKHAKQDFPNLKEMSEVAPRILNINYNCSTDDMPAVNVNIYGLDNPQKLFFNDNHFTVIRAAEVLQHYDIETVPEILNEWKRILHPNGELHIAVPNADTILNKLTDKSTLDDEQVNELLGELMGDKSDNKTIYSLTLLKKLLHDAGFTNIMLREQEVDLAYQSGFPDVRDPEYTLTVAAGFIKTSHAHDMVLGEKTFLKKCETFRKTHPDNPAATYIVAVYNEEKNLPHFLSFLESSKNETGTDREFIFVLNGCTDKSEDVIRRYTKDSNLKTKMVTSGMGITTAFIKGIESKSLDGFIGKIDSDVILHPHLLDLMQIHLVENPEAQVTYAEPMPSDAQTAYNEPDFNPSIATNRLYYTSKTSLNRVDPFARPAIKSILEGFKAEDMFLSFYFIYFYGLSAISRTPHGHIYAKTVGNYDDLVKQMSRMNSEMQREFGAYPPFGVLDSITEQEFYDGDYKDIYTKAQGEATYVSEWTRIMSTK